MTRRRAAWSLLLLALVAPAAGAQRLPELRLEGGLAYITQRGFSLENAALLAVLWRPQSERLGFVTSANLTYAQDSLAAAQGVAAIDVDWGPSQRFRTEAGVVGASFSLRSAGRGGNGNAFVRQHAVAANYGVWAGVALGGTERDGVSSRSAMADLGLWQRWGPLYVSAVATRLQSADWPLLLASGVIRDPEEDVYDLSDAQLTAQLRYGPHDVAVTYTARTGVAGTDATLSALMWSGTVQVMDRIALVGSMGRQLADPLRGLPQARIATASVRISLGPKPLPVLERSLIARATVEPIAGGGGDLEVTVFAADTMRVAVAGDFSDWRPLPMERVDGTWVARIRLPSGKFRIAVRVNDGEWRAPRNLARVRDDFGGEAGLLVIP